MLRGGGQTEGRAPGSSRRSFSSGVSAAPNVGEEEPSLSERPPAKGRHGSKQLLSHPAADVTGRADTQWASSPRDTGLSRGEIRGLGSVGWERKVLQPARLLGLP